METPAGVRGLARPYTVSVGRAIREEEFRRERRKGRVEAFRGIIAGPVGGPIGGLLAKRSEAAS